LRAIRIPRGVALTAADFAATELTTNEDTEPLGCCVRWPRAATGSSGEMAAFFGGFAFPTDWLA
jgi:hypothetical protein